jgi:hypothetical protein
VLLFAGNQPTVPAVHNVRKNASYLSFFLLLYFKDDGPEEDICG